MRATARTVEVFLRGQRVAAHARLRRGDQDETPVVFAGEEAERERRPRRHAHSKLVRQREVLVLNVAVHQGIEELHRDGPGQAPRRRQGGDFRDVPGRRVRNAQVLDFPGAHEAGHGLQQFFGGRDAVPDVQPIEVDVVGAQTPKRALQRGVQVLGAGAAGLRALAGGEALLGGEVAQ